MRALKRYAVYDEIASGGMAAVHLGVLRGDGGFARLVAIKVMHAHYAKEKHFRAMFLDEARIVARVRDPHVVSTLDILEEEGELFLVMDYVNGPSLAKLLKDLAAADDPMPLGVAVAIAMDVLDGLHAAHEARSEAGEPLGVVHRDVSPQNVLVGSDGLARVMDFGIATAVDQLHRTEPGEVKGKVGYMAPEHALAGAMDRRADVYAAGVVLFEALTLRRPFSGKSFAEVALKHVNEAAPRPSAFRSAVTPELDAIVLRAMAKDPSARYATALEMRDALHALGLRVAPHELGSWVTQAQPDFFRERESVVTALHAVDRAPAAAEVNEVPTRAELTVSPAPSTPRRRSLVLGVVALGAVAGAVTVAVSSLRARASDHAVAAPTQTATPAAVAAAAATSAVGAELAPAPSETPAPSASTATHAASLHARIRATSTTARVDAGGPEPNCCVGNLRINVGSCHENCPPGT